MRLVRTCLRTAWSLARGTFALLVSAWRAAFGAVRALIGGSFLAYDFAKSRRSLRGGVLHCPRGHAVETEGGVYQCSRCGFAYRGSILYCGNPECPAPITQFLDCPDCGLSVRNPYRWGRS